jgi:hypothetical protein
VAPGSLLPFTLSANFWPWAPGEFSLPPVINLFLVLLISGNLFLSLLFRWTSRVNFVAVLKRVVHDICVWFSAVTCLWLSALSFWGILIHPLASHRLHSDVSEVRALTLRKLRVGGEVVASGAFLASGVSLHSPRGLHSRAVALKVSSFINLEELALWGGFTSLSHLGSSGSSLANGAFALGHTPCGFLATWMGILKSSSLPHHGFELRTLCVGFVLPSLLCVTDTLWLSAIAWALELSDVSCLWGVGWLGSSLKLLGRVLPSQSFSPGWVYDLPAGFFACPLWLMLFEPAVLLIILRLAFTLWLYRATQSVSCRLIEICWHVASLLSLSSHLERFVSLLGAHLASRIFAAFRGPLSLALEFFWFLFSRLGAVRFSPALSPILLSSCVSHL